MTVQIFDEKNLPLPGANAQESDAAGNIIPGGWADGADTDGFIDIPDYLGFVKFTFIGYAPQTQAVESLPANIQMQPGETVLPEFTVWGTPTPTPAPAKNYSWVLWTVIGLAVITAGYFFIFHPKKLKLA